MIKMQQQIYVFLWLHNRLMGNANRLEHQLANDQSCTGCNAAEETSLQVLRDCKAAREVWRNVGDPALEPNFITENLQEWFSRYINYSLDGAQTNEVWQLIFHHSLCGIENEEIV